MKVGIAFDLQPVSGPPADGPDDRFEEFDKPETVDAIAEVIRGEGHDVVLLGDGRPFLERVLADPPDFVWNIAEGEGVGRCREARVPAALEMLGIPYSGSDPLTLGVCLDKGMTRRALPGSFDPPPGASPQAEWVRMPWAAELPPLAWTPENESRIFSKLDRLQLPVILKPAFEGSSKGIRDRVVAHDDAEFVEIWQRLVRDYAQNIVIEEFITGEEVTVGVCGNPGPDGLGPVEVIGSMQIFPRCPTPEFVYSLEAKRDWRNQIRYVTPAQLDPGVLKILEDQARNAYIGLGCRDFARLDFRIDLQGQVFLIEVNPLPGLAPVTSDLVILAEGYGLSHADLIRKLFRISLERNGLLR